MVAPASSTGMLNDAEHYSDDDDDDDNDKKFGGM
jgi:hypothetical protein